MSDTTTDDLCTATSRRTGAPGAGEGMALALVAAAFTRARRPEAASAASDAMAVVVDDMLLQTSEERIVEKMKELACRYSTKQDVLLNDQSAPGKSRRRHSHELLLLLAWK